MIYSRENRQRCVEAAKNLDPDREALARILADHGLELVDVTARADLFMNESLFFMDSYQVEITVTVRPSVDRLKHQVMRHHHYYPRIARRVQGGSWDQAVTGNVVLDRFINWSTEQVNRSTEKDALAALFAPYSDNFVAEWGRTRSMFRWSPLKTTVEALEPVGAPWELVVKVESPDEMGMVGIWQHVYPREVGGRRRLFKKEHPLAALMTR